MDYELNKGTNLFIKISASSNIPMSESLPYLKSFLDKRSIHTINDMENNTKSRCVKDSRMDELLRTNDIMLVKI